MADDDFAFDAPPLTRDERRALQLAEALNKPLDATNKGFQMLSKMGYRTGTGLGR